MISTSKINEGSDYEFEWCKTCKEYDQDKHCCPRYNKVIRNAVEEMKQPKTGHWITKIKSDLKGDMWPTNPKCSECGGEPYYSNSIYNYKFCPYCGAKMVDVPDVNDGKLSEISTGSESEANHG